MIPRRNRGQKSRTNDSRVVTALRQKVDALQNSIRGRILKPSLVPPSFVSSPFNTVTIESRHTVSNKAVPIYEKDLASFLCNQVGLFTMAASTANYLKVEWRLHSISAWSLTSSSLRLLSQDFLVQESWAELCNSASFAQKNMYACTGYEFPVSHQSHVFSTDSSDQDKRVLFQLQTDIACTVIVHSRISWRSAEQGKVALTYIPQPASPSSGSVCEDFDHLQV